MESAKEKNRRLENQYVLDQMKSGGSLCVVSAEDTWWPPYKPIKKDKKAIAKLYGEKVDE
jgi:hypothetical protein